MDRWLVPVGLVVLFVIVGLLLTFLRRPAYVTTGAVFLPNLANDTVVICRGWDEAELTKILGDFTRSYQDRLPSTTPFRVEQRGDEFRITFPGDIPPTMLSFLVNYLYYPKGLDLTDRRIDAVGIVTLTRAFPIPRADYEGKQARIYVPSNDKKYDEVYFAVGSEYFRQPFTSMRWEPSSDARIPDGIGDLR